MAFLTNTPRLGESPAQTEARYRSGPGEYTDQGYIADVKATNPKDAVGVKKAPVSTVSAPFILAVGNAMLEGGLKYGRHNYRTIGVRASVYYDALMRHMMAWWEGQDLDPESGESHIVKAAACLAILFDGMVIGNLNDDRPPKLPETWIDDANRKAKALVEKYPNPKAAHTEVEREAEKTAFQKGLEEGLEIMQRSWNAGLHAAGEPKENARVEGAAYFDPADDFYNKAAT